MVTVLLLDTKFKVEESYKRQKCSQCRNRPTYNQIKLTYYTYHSIFVKSEKNLHLAQNLRVFYQNAPSSLKHTLSTTNYVLCTIYKQTSRKYKNISNQKCQLVNYHRQLTPPPIHRFNIQPLEIRQINVRTQI